VELNRLEKTYLENDRRSFEIEKTVSLGQLDPLALVELKENGSCTFELTEELFDYDYPGHYLRKIKSIAVSIPAIVGPYQQVHATLTLQGSKTLLRPDGNAMRHLLGDQNVAEPDTSTLRADWRAQQQIALSQGVNDAGLFELNFRDERYLPFEGSGAVSRWKLDMPKQNNLIDFDSISDVIITIRYTAEQGGDTFAEDVNTALGVLAPRGVYLMRSLQHEYSSEWHAFLHPRDTNPNHELSLSFTEAVFPPNFEVWAPRTEGALPSLRSVWVNAQWENVNWENVDLQGAALEIQLSKPNGDVLDFNIDNAGSDPRITVIGNPFATWNLQVNRPTIPEPLQLKVRVNRSTIPEPLRLKDENRDDVVVMINDTPHYTLDAARLHDVGLIVYFEHDPA